MYELVPNGQILDPNLKAGDISTLFASYHQLMTSAVRMNSNVSSVFGLAADKNANLLDTMLYVDCSDNQVSGKIKVAVVVLW